MPEQKPELSPEERAQLEQLVKALEEFGKRMKRVAEEMNAMADSLDGGLAEPTDN